MSATASPPDSSKSARHPGRTASTAATLVPVPHALVTSSRYDPASPHTVREIVSVDVFAPLIRSEFATGCPSRSQRSIVGDAVGASIAVIVAGAPDTTLRLAGGVAIVDVAGAAGDPGTIGPSGMNPHCELWARITYECGCSGLLNVSTYGGVASTYPNDVPVLMPS
jgi:hypothetical protein